MAKRKNEIDNFKALLNANFKSILPTNSFWVVAKEIDEDSATMTATGVIDDLDFFDILLGIGDCKVFPASNSKCLIGSIAGKEAQTFLIYAEKIDKVIYHNGENKGIVKVEPTTDKLNALEQSINDLKQIFTSWTPSPQDGGAALKSVVSSWAGQQLTETQISDLENEKITH